MTTKEYSHTENTEWQVATLLLAYIADFFIARRFHGFHGRLHRKECSQLVCYAECTRPEAHTSDSDV